MKKSSIVIKLILAVLVAIAIAGIYKFNFTNDDIYIINNDGEVVPIDELQDTIYFDERDQKWKDEYGICHTCTFENGFNPHGWLLSDAEHNFATKVIQVEQEHGIDLSWNRITSQEQLNKLVAEAIAEFSSAK